MLDQFYKENEIDANGNPTGGVVKGTGLAIQWQRGPLGRDGNRQSPNGAFVETVIAAAKQRIEFYQTANDGKFACAANERASMHLDHALDALNERTKEREARQVEGTHAV